jgi:hypothetical protein
MMLLDCHVIAVDPMHQGRGAGALLAGWGLDTGEASGLPVYMEASPTTAGMYEKMGCKHLKKQIVHKASDLGSKEDVAIPLMVKLPSKGSSFDTTLLRD